MVEVETINGLHGRLLRDTFGRSLSDADAFLVYFLLHIHRTILAAPNLTDRPGIQEVAALTQRGAALSLASMWEGMDDKRANYVYWYQRWNNQWVTDHGNGLAPSQRERLAQLKARIEEHPFVAWFEPDD